MEVTTVTPGIRTTSNAIAPNHLRERRSGCASLRTCSISSRISEADWYRRERSFSNALSMTAFSPGETVELTSCTAAGFRLRMALWTSAAVSPVKARRPAAISYKTSPQGKQIGAGVQFFLAYLFGRHIAGGPYRDPLAMDNARSSS